MALLLARPAAPAADSESRRLQEQLGHGKVASLDSNGERGRQGSIDEHPFLLQKECDHLDVVLAHRNGKGRVLRGHVHVRTSFQQEGSHAQITLHHSRDEEGSGLGDILQSGNVGVKPLGNGQTIDSPIVDRQEA